jgi:hypothetical protein
MEEDEDANEVNEEYCWSRLLTESLLSIDENLLCSTERIIFDESSLIFLNSVDRRGVTLLGRVGVLEIAPGDGEITGFGTNACGLLVVNEVILGGILLVEELNDVLISSVLHRSGGVIAGLGVVTLDAGLGGTPEGDTFPLRDASLSLL